MGLFKYPRKTFRLDGKMFTVTYDDRGPISVLRRDVAYKGRPWECVRDRCLWHRSHKQPKFRTQPGSMTRRVLAQFQQEMRSHG